MRMARQLEPPAADEGLAAIETIPFLREPAAGGRAGVVVALDAAEVGKDPQSVPPALLALAAPDAPCLLYAWRPGAGEAERARLQVGADAVARATGAIVELALCTHPAGPPICWCRPPLPALPLAFARRHGVDLSASTLIGRSAADRALARALGMTFRALAAA
jgi:hypothetical protein